MSRVFFSPDVSYTSCTVQLSTGREVDLDLAWNVAVSTYTECHGERMRDAELELARWEYARPEQQAELSAAEEDELDALVWRNAEVWAEEVAL
jgi:hypothetical protein